MTFSQTQNSYRYALLIAYDGSAFCGWQRQRTAPSVQQYLEEALGKIFNPTPTLFCAGRTDTGVHALGQVAHLTLSAPFDPKRLPLAINFHLNTPSIRVLEAQHTAPDFHARFGALERTYTYRLLNTPIRPPFGRELTSWEKRPLDVPLMQEAARLFEGNHDFSAFRAAHCQANSPIRTIQSFRITQENSFIFFTVTARSFLYHQVRNMVGSLLLIGRKKQPPSFITTLLHNKNRQKAGETAPPEGLFFAHVAYAQKIFTHPPNTKDTLLFF